MKKQILHKIASVVFCVMVVGFAVAFYALGWTEPTIAPPNGNVSAPLNVGSIAQAKSGGLILNTGSYPNGLIVQYGNVGIGTTSPSAKLDVNGGIRAATLQVTTGATAGRVLTSDASGNATWQAAGGGSGVGGSGTASYIPKWSGATTLGNSLIFDNATSVGINTSSPSSTYSARLDVNGSIHWGTASLRGYLLADGGSSIELGGSGTPYIDFSNDNSNTATNDYDVRLRLTGNDVLTVEGGDICHSASGNCLSDTGISCDWAGWKGSMTFTVHEGSKYAGTYYTMILNCTGGQVAEIKYLSCAAANAAPYNAGIDCSR